MYVCIIYTRKVNNVDFYTNGRKIINPNYMHRKISAINL